MKRRNFNAAATSLLLATLASAVRAQSTQPIRIEVGFPAGGGFDNIGRQLATPLGEILGRNVIVENRTGAAGRIALEYVRAAPPNGEVISVTNQGAMTLFPYIYRNLRFDPVKDFTPISRLVTFDYAIAVGSAVPVRTFAEYMDWLQKNPGKGSHASPGNGTTPHLLGVWFHQKIGIPAVHVPYRGSPPMVVDLIGGQVVSSLNTVGDLIEFHRSGKIRILATTGAERSPLLPDVPTLKESGVDIVVPGWVGLYGPAGMAPDLVASYNQAVAKALQAPALKENMLKLGWTISPSSPAEMGEQQRKELAAWAPVVKASGITPED